MDTNTRGSSMKTALLIGCGGKRGEDIVYGCQDAGFNVINIGSTESKLENVKNIKIEWKTLDIPQLHKILKFEDKIDFIFFNQNGSSLSKDNFIGNTKTVDLWQLVKHWTQSYWLSCQMPFTLIHTLQQNLNSNTKIGWMLSCFIDKEVAGVDNHADYSGYKFTNYLIMKNFNQKYDCFGISPDFEGNTKPGVIRSLVKDICLNTKSCNGEVF